MLVLLMNLIVLMVKSIKAFFLLIPSKTTTFAPQFKICDAMKRLFYLLFLAATIVATGCSNNKYTPSNNSAVSIKGHTYKYTNNSNYISLYFATNGTCTYTSSMNGEFLSTSNLTYRIDDNNVDIYTDNSSYWQESRRNTLLYHMVYLSSSDALTWENIVFKRVN